MSKVYRVYVEKKSAYAIEANELLNNIQTQLKIETVTGVHVVNRYDLQGVSEDVLKQGIPTILSEPMVDEIYQEDYPLNEHQKAFAIEFLPGQYDQRADACEQCFQVLTGRFLALRGRHRERLHYKQRLQAIRPRCNPLRLLRCLHGRREILVSRIALL